MIHSAIMLVSTMVGQVYMSPPSPVYFYPPPIVHVCPAPVYVYPPIYIRPAPVYVRPAPIYVHPAPVYVSPPTISRFFLDGMTERTRRWVTIPYRDGSEKRVPVINGYVPRVVRHVYSDCSVAIEYHYDERITYASIQEKMREPPRLVEPIRSVYPGL